MAGYCGWSMSNNAVKAYEDGEMPYSVWSKERIISCIRKQVRDNEIELNCSLGELHKTPLEVLRRNCLQYSSWHHTGKYYRETDFYSLDVSSIEKLTDEMLRELTADYKEKQKRLKEEKAAEVPEIWECSFLEWTGPRKHLKAKEITEVGTIKGSWFYREDGHKKSLNARGFRKIRQILEDDAADNT